MSIQGGRSESRSRERLGKSAIEKPPRKILPPTGHGKSQLDGGQNPGNMSREHRGSQGKGRGLRRASQRLSYQGTQSDSTVTLVTSVPSTGKVFVTLQLSLTLTGVVTSTLYNKIYQLTMEKFIGTCFALSSFLSFLAILPIG